MPSSLMQYRLFNPLPVAPALRYLPTLLLFIAISGCSTLKVAPGCSPDLVPDQPRPQIKVVPGAVPTWGDAFGLSVEQSKSLYKYRCRDSAIRGEPPPKGC